MNSDLFEPTCSAARAAIEQLAEGPLGADERSRLERHIEGCADCREEYRSDQALSQVLNSISELNCPPQVSKRVMAEVRARRVRSALQSTRRTVRQLLFPVWRPALAVAAVVVWLALPLFQGPSAVETRFTADEVAEGLQQAKIALAYIGDAGRRTGLAVRDEAIGSGVVAPIRHVARTALPATRNFEGNN